MKESRKGIIGPVLMVVVIIAAATGAALATGESRWWLIPVCAIAVAALAPAVYGAIFMFDTLGKWIESKLR